MARRRKSSSMVCPPSACGPYCVAMCLLAAVFMGAGLWMLVSGYHMQSAGNPFLRTLLWYFGGFILFAIACKCKRKACGICK